MYPIIIILFFRRVHLEYLNKEHIYNHYMNLSVANSYNYFNKMPFCPIVIIK